MLTGHIWQPEPGTSEGTGLEGGWGRGTLCRVWGRSLVLRDFLGKGHHEGRLRKDAEGIPTRSQAGLTLQKS